MVSVVASAPSAIKPTLPLMKPADNFMIARKKLMKMVFLAAEDVSSKSFSIKLLLFSILLISSHVFHGLLHLVHRFRQGCILPDHFLQGFHIQHKHLCPFPLNCHFFVPCSNFVDAVPQPWEVGEGCFKGGFVIFMPLLVPDLWNEISYRLDPWHSEDSLCRVPLEEICRSLWVVCFYPCWIPIQMNLSNKRIRYTMLLQTGVMMDKTVATKHITMKRRHVLFILIILSLFAFLLTNPFFVA